MKHDLERGLVGQTLRFVAVLLILLALTPRLVSAVVELYYFISRTERVPSGNPLKVEAPIVDRILPKNPQQQVK